MAIFSIRNFAIKQLMKRGDDGIMKMPSNMKADFGEAVLIKELIDAGIDPKLIKNEQQLVNVLDGIQDMRKQMSEMAIQESKGITSAKIMDMKGKEIPKGSKIMGGGGVGPASGSGTAGTANTGGGGGGAGGTSPTSSGGAGGSGIIIIRYKFQ